MKTRCIYLGLLMLSLVSQSCRGSLNASKNSHHHGEELAAQEVFAKVHFEAKSGSEVEGNAWFLKNNTGVKIVVKVKNVSAGRHGIHIHEKGDCSAPDASSAGGHFNPGHLSHGSPNPSKYHMGDLGNIIIDQDGTGVLDLIIPKSDFHPDFANWSSIIGKSLVLHSKADDLVSQPTGDSGERIACGIIIKG